MKKEITWIEVLLISLGLISLSVGTIIYKDWYMIVGGFLMIIAGGMPINIHKG